MKSDEKTISALTAQAHNAEADKRTLQRKLAASERRVQDLEKRLADQQAASDDKIRELTDKLSLEMAKVSDMIQQLVSYMTGKGDVSLAGTIHETVVAGIREEVRKEMRQEYQGIIDSQAAEIAALKALQNHDNDGGESPQTTIKKLEQRNQDLNRDLHGQKTEGKYNKRNNMTPADEADLNGEEVPESTFDVSEEEFTEVMDVINSARKNAVKSNGRKKGQKVPHRTQEAVENYVKGITEKTYIHTDGAKIAIYRNQSYFLGSVKSAKRFARLVSLTQSAKNCKRNVQKYFHDILNRVVGTVKEELVSILPHKWVEPAKIPLVY